MTKRLLFLVVLCAAATSAPAQSIRDHYVSKSEQDGTIYHTMPCTLFENSESGDLTFDVTYKDRQDARATINFTYEMDGPSPADSVRFSSGRTMMGGPVSKLYIEPGRKRWKHRYSFSAPFASLCTFFDGNATPEVTLYVAGKPHIYRVKPSAWRSYAPIGNKIFEMIRINERN